MSGARTVGIATVVVALAAVAASAAFHHRSSASVPTAPVVRGTFTDYLTVRGEIRPVRSIVLTAPSAGGDLQIVDLVTGGTRVEVGDIIIRFDASAQQRTLDQKDSERKQAEATIAKAEAEQRRRVAAAHADVEQARSELERARLDLAKVELSSRVDAEKLAVAVTRAEQHLEAARQIERAEGEAAEADVLISRQKRDKAQYDVQESERIMGALTMRAPAAGTVSLLPNQRAGAGFGRGAPEFKRGDRAWFGAPIAELPDLTTVQMNCRLEETDRARVSTGGAVVVRADAVPDRELQGTVKEISTMAKPDFTTWPPVRNFDLAIALSDTDARLRPGMNATARIAVEQVPGVLMVPVNALFQSGGAAIVYRVTGDRIDRLPVTVVRRNREQVVVSGGVHEGDRVSLKAPDTEER